jgi:hypothetical protein
LEDPKGVEFPEKEKKGVEFPEKEKEPDFIAKPLARLFVDRGLSD